MAFNSGTPATIGTTVISHGISGLDLNVLLGNYNFFSGALANMSLVGGAHRNQDLLTAVVDNLDRANTVELSANIHWRSKQAIIANAVQTSGHVY